jgi:hypothetical protein
MKRDVFRIVFSLLLIAAGISSALTADWQVGYTRLKAKIDREFNKPTVSEAQSTPDPIGEFIRWMAIKAADRNQASGFSAQAQAAKNPYWEKQFLDLQELAQKSGDDTLWTAMMKVMKIRDGDQWSSAVRVCGPAIGRRLFQAAEQHAFDKEMIRDTARCLMRFANRDLEYGKFAFYSDRTNYFGDLEADGITIVMPKGNFNVDCEMRSFFHVQDKGEPLFKADLAMKSGEEIRETCEFFGLSPERQDTTDLMEQYLREKKVICQLPPGKGHSFFLNLAKQYKLPKAQEYIEGFYAVLKGKVEIEKEGVKKTAPGAKVTVTDTRDKYSWETTADSEGKYKIKGMILHKFCSPFPVTAEYDGYTEDTSYEGILEEPDKSKEDEFNIVITVDKWQGSISGESEFQSSPGSATTQLGGDYRTRRRWTLRVTLVREPTTEVQSESRRLIGMSFNYPKTMEFWKVKTAVLEYRDMMAGKLMDAKSQGVELKLDANETASGSRILTAQECRLRLTVDKGRKTYKLSGHIDARQLPTQGTTEFLHRLGDIKTKSRAPAETVDIKEEITVKGGFTGDDPLELSGSKDELADLENESPEGAEFLTSLEKAVSGGVLKGKVNWNLTKKK